jgi:UDP-N-acetylglucosamine 1-carboxyvinyltransferase
MDKIVVTGNGPLNGQIPIAGAKNACLTLMPATLLSDEPLTLTNAPRLSDIRTMTSLLQSPRRRGGGAAGRARCWRCRRTGSTTTRADYDIVRKMRASILVLGPLLAREGRGGGLAARRLRHRRAARRPASARRSRRWARSWSCATAMCTRRRAAG